MTARPSGCEARVEGDEMACSRCALRWDRHDEDPPNCRRRKADRPARAVVFNVPAYGAPVTIKLDAAPLELPDDLARAMGDAYEAAREFCEAADDGSDCRRPGMRAAWRVFLDRTQ